MTYSDDDLQVYAGRIVRVTLSNGATAAGMLGYEMPDGRFHWKVHTRPTPTSQRVTDFFAEDLASIDLD